jgi:hypothetical protein
MDNRAVLDVAPLPDPDKVDVAAHNHMEPEAGTGADHDIADNLCRILDKRAGGDLGPDSAKSFQHD